MSDCVFCNIAHGRLDAHVVHRDELVLAFLDTHPIRPGHTQIIPHEHTSCFDDLPAATASRMVLAGQRIAKALKRLAGVPRVAFLFTGGDVAHAHAHLVPMHDKTDITSRRYIAEESLTFRSMSCALDADLANVAAQLTRISDEWGRDV